MATKKAAPSKTSTEKTSGKTKEETFHVRGEQLLGKVKEIIKEGNVRRIIIKDKEGKTLIEVPMTIGVIGVVFAPVLAAVGAIAALVAECSITVEREI
jgi:hypothetical protein